MHWLPRNLALWALVALTGGATAWVLSFGTLPEADFTWCNETEIQSIDPAVVRGQPEGRILMALFEPLYRHAPPPADDPRSKDPYASIPQPAAASAMPTISPDGTTYTVPVRKEARWSDGTPVTAHDFYYSWQRMLHPGTGAHYVDPFYHIKNAKRYTTGEIRVGDAVEVELTVGADGNPLSRPEQSFPRGAVLYGKLTAIAKPPEPTVPSDVAAEAREALRAEWKERWVYAVEIAGRTRRFAKSSVGELPPDVERCRHVLLDFRQVGLEVIDDHTLRITLGKPTPFFTELMAFYPLVPVNRKCVEAHGSPDWTRPENLVCNGAFRLQFRRIRDRIRLVKSETYWNAASVQLQTADALAVSSRTTALNMFLNGQTDWITSAPDSVVKEVADRPDFNTGPFLCTYYYMLNTTRKPLDDPRVRRALAMSVDRREICEAILKIGQQPAHTYVPPGLSPYQSPPGIPFDVQAARKLLAEAGYPDGRGMRVIEILYNKDETHERIAQVVQQQWKKHLGINVVLANQEWGVYLQTRTKLEYDVCRAAWIGDYHDPNTFLDMWTTGNANNEVGWSDAEFDQLIEEAAGIVDPITRTARLQAAEAILLRECPIVPIYFYVSKNMVRSYVRGFHANRLDQHPIQYLSVDKEAKRRILAGEGLR